MGSSQRNHALAGLTPPRLGSSARPWLYCISDGSGWAGWEQLRTAGEAGVDFIQIREKELLTAELVDYCRQLRAALAHRPVRLLLNRRYDVALAAGLDGVHLPAHGLPCARVRPQVPPGFLLAQSCHSPAEVAVSGADFCVLGPIFATPSKLTYGSPLGLAALAAAVQTPAPPVLALGGITLANAAACLAQGAVGVAGIRLFADASAVSRLRRNEVG